MAITPILGLSKKIVFSDTESDNDSDFKQITAKASPSKGNADEFYKKVA